MSTVTTVINTLNSESTLETTLKSVKDLGPIVVVDMQSSDNTVAIAEKYGAHVFQHQPLGYVEPARNFAISQAKTEWVLVLDSDEEISSDLITTINKIISESTTVTHVYFPRKNIIFGQWMQHTGWWPDEKMRLFRKGKVTWKNEIHSEPECIGEALHLELNESNAIVHHHYTSVSQWVQRMDKYTTVQAQELVTKHYVFEWRDLIRKPLSEFITRFFVWEGWKDGVNGCALSLMQALSWVIVYMKVKEIQKLESKAGDEKFLQDFGEELDSAESEVGFYLEKLGLQSQLKRWIQKVLP